MFVSLKLYKGIGYGQVRIRSLNYLENKYNLFWLFCHILYNESEMGETGRQIDNESLYWNPTQVACIAIQRTEDNAKPVSATARATSFNVISVKYVIYEL